MVFPGEDDYMATGPERSDAFNCVKSLQLRWGIRRHMKYIKNDSSSDGSRPSDAFGDHQRGSSALELANSSIAIPLRFSEANKRSRRLRKPPSRLVEKKDSSSDGSGPSGASGDHQHGFPALEFANSSLGIPLRLNEANKPSRRLRKPPSKLVEKKSEEEIQAIVRDKTAKTLSSKDAVKPENRFKDPIRVSTEDLNLCKEFRSEEGITTRKRGRAVMAEPKRKEPVKFSLQLSRNEIEEDFMQMVGRRPQRRPKKRPRIVQKRIDNLFPGLNLTEVTPDLYKVPENPK